LQSEYGKQYFPDGIDHPLNKLGRILEVLDDAYANKKFLDEDKRARREEARELKSRPSSSEAWDDELVRDRLEELSGGRELAEELDRDIRANRELTRQGEIHESRIDRLKTNAKGREKRLRGEKAAAVKEVKKTAREGIKVLRVENREKLKELRVKHNEQVAELKAKNAAALTRSRERRADTATRGKIRKTVTELDALLRHPTQTRHVPEVMRTTVADFLGTLVSGGTRTTGTIRYNALDKLKAAYERMAGDGDTALSLDPELLAKMDALKPVIETTPVRDMDSDQLNDLYDVARGVLASVKTYDRMFTAAIKQRVSQTAAAVMTENYAQAEERGYKMAKFAIAQAGGRLFNTELLDSFHMFDEMGPTMYSVFRALRKGMDVKVRDTVRAQREMSAALAGVERSTKPANPKSKTPKPSSVTPSASCCRTSRKSRSERCNGRKPCHTRNRCDECVCRRRKVEPFSAGIRQKQSFNTSLTSHSRHNIHYRYKNIDKTKIM
jgi:hypothetical protein